MHTNLTPAAVFESIPEPKMQEQLALELEGLELGASRYRDRLAKHAETNTLGDHASSRKLIDKAMHYLLPAYNEWLAAPARGRLAGHKNFFKKSGLSPEEVCFTALRSVLSRLEASSVQTVAVKIAGDLLDTIEYRKFKDQAGGLLAAIEKRTKSTHKKHRKAVIMGAKRKFAQIPDEPYSLPEKVKIGVIMLDLMVANTGLIETVHTLSKGRDMIAVCRTQEARDWLDKYHDHAELLSPTHLPMIVPPRPWTGLFEGGYWSRSLGGRPQSAIKTHTRRAAGMIHSADMAPVWNVINIVQSTPWRINEGVLSVLRASSDLDYLFAGIPSADPIITPAPWGDDQQEAERVKQMQPEEWKRWKQQRTAEWDAFHFAAARRKSCIEKLRLANRFVGETIYFPHGLDWRGRMYPLAHYLNPQGDDVARGLLEFAEGKPLTERGVYWLRVQLANTFGNDKVSLDERVQWAIENEQDIVAYGSDPLTNRGWADVDKPWQFLAACVDYAGWKADPEHHLSHLPVQQDGSNNGLQHFAAMLRDEKAGRSVNLVPCEKPADVYQEVADVATELCEADLHGEDQERALMASIWKDKIVRALVKRNTMTVPYGVTNGGMTQQNEDYLKQYEYKHGVPYIELPSEVTTWQAATYLTSLTSVAIGRVMTSAYTAMQYLRECVGAFAKTTERPVKWRTPAGHLAVQDYRKVDAVRIDVYCGGMRWRNQYNLDTDSLDVTKQKGAIAPNFVHSLDAAHMMRTVRSAYAQGVTSFSLIHDSYGTHASDIDVLNATLRDEFVEMYSETDMLSSFRQNLIDQTPVELQEELDAAMPQSPVLGTLDLRQVRQSTYFFA